jgi:nucleoid DNA-binding protein
MRPVISGGMLRKKDIASRLAHELRVPPAVAADQVDRAVADILRRIRHGQATALPGIGILGPQKSKRPGRRRPE